MKEQIKGSFFLSQESSFKRMSRLAKNEINYGKYISPEELINNIDKITPDSINYAAGKYLALENYNSIILAPEN